MINVNDLDCLANPIIVLGHPSPLGILEVMVSEDLALDQDQLLQLLLDDALSVGFWICADVAAREQQGGAYGKAQSVPDTLKGGPQLEKIYGRPGLSKTMTGNSLKSK